eukprot:gnl/MRDRNA2_/MRDRNA2_33982_c0_seq1.p1 gnl/MRDRNA2_/MRDRNA2_33982_c0~~gnl/MRDRNA2_/MRDRNA2_33982_c0_seq1.p1  ORF type:complete len:347 (+),score=67.38 gnl/MRDRNA2_/MRDRNA2_33982_c0_seq1:57-1043(+)
MFADGIEFVKRTKDAAFDVVIIDGIDFSHGDIADYGNVLFSRELYNEMHRILRPGGVLAQYMSDVVRSEELKAAGFNQSVGLGVDIDSFFGGGAKFSLAAKDVEQPLASRISKQIVDGELHTKTRYLSAHSLEQSLKHIGRRLKGGGGGGGGDGCSGSSRCSNVILWDGGLDGIRPELQLNAEPGDRHTDENGYCTYGFTGPDDHCDAPCHGTNSYVCKCVSQEFAIEKHDEERKIFMIMGGSCMGVFVLTIICAATCWKEKNDAKNVGFAICAFIFFAFGIGFLLGGYLKDPTRYYIGCTERGGAGTIQVSIAVMVFNGVMQILLSY